MIKVTYDGTRGYRPPVCLADSKRSSGHGGEKPHSVAAPPASYADHRALSCSKLLCRVADWFFLHTGRSADFHILAPKRNFAPRFLADSCPDLLGLSFVRASRPSYA